MGEPAHRVRNDQPLQVVPESKGADFEPLYQYDNHQCDRNSQVEIAGCRANEFYAVAIRIDGLDVLERQRTNPVGEQNEQRRRAHERNKSMCTRAACLLGEALPCFNELFGGELGAGRTFSGITMNVV